jgi:hypothetical protein
MPDGTSVALQKAVVVRLRGNADVTALVPAADIFDRSTRPERPICVNLGEDQIVRDPITLADDCVRVYFTMHLWHRAQDFEIVKNLGDAIRKAMSARFVVSGIHVAYLAFGDARYMRDPGGEYVHGVLTFNALVQEPAE